jgi:hypothetical protein
MLNNTLVTNEVKDESGTEVEYTRLGTVGRTTDFAKKNETYNLPERIQLAHKETGSGTKLRRSSKLEFLIWSTGADGTLVVTRARIVLDIPVGNLAVSTVPKSALARLGSLTFTLGTNTFLYDGTGNGAVCLLNGDH